MEPHQPGMHYHGKIDGRAAYGIRVDQEGNITWGYWQTDGTYKRMGPLLNASFEHSYRLDLCEWTPPITDAMERAILKQEASMAEEEFRRALHAIHARFLPYLTSMQVVAVKRTVDDSEPEMVEWGIGSIYERMGSADEWLRGARHGMAKQRMIE